MLIFYRNNGGISRSYDHTGEGFAPLPLKQNDDNQNFTWNLSLVQDLLAVFSSIFISAIAYGIMMVMISFRLETNVKNEILISHPSNFNFSFEIKYLESLNGLSEINLT